MIVVAGVVEVASVVDTAVVELAGAAVVVVVVLTVVVLAVVLDADPPPTALPPEHAPINEMPTRHANAALVAPRSPITGATLGAFNGAEILPLRDGRVAEQRGAPRCRTASDSPTDHCALRPRAAPAGTGDSPDDEWVNSGGRHDDE